MKAYSLDLRQKIVDAYTNQEGSIRQVAQRFKVAKSFVQKLLKRYQQEGTLAPKRQGGGFAAKLAEHLHVVEQLVEQDNDATLAELCERLYQRTGVSVSQSTLCRQLQQLKLTRKKSPSMPLKLKRNGCKSSDSNTGRVSGRCAPRI